MFRIHTVKVIKVWYNLLRWSDTVTLYYFLMIMFSDISAVCQRLHHIKSCFPMCNVALNLSWNLQMLYLGNGWLIPYYTTVKKRVWSFPTNNFLCKKQPGVNNFQAWFNSIIRLLVFQTGLLTLISWGEFCKNIVHQVLVTVYLSNATYSSPFHSDKIQDSPL